MKKQSACLFYSILILFFHLINASAQTEEGWQASKVVITFLPLFQVKSCLILQS